MRTCAIGTISDAHGFVHATLNALDLTLTPDQWRELEQEGVAQLWALWRQYDGRGTFSGYAKRYLPRRMIDQWHALHPEHYRSGSRSDRTWKYGEHPIPLHAITPDAEPSYLDPTPPAPGPLADAIACLPHWQRPMAHAVTNLMLDGLGTREIARQLSVTQGDVVRVRRMIARALCPEEVAA